MPQVYPKCKADHQLPYIDAQGYYWPCCWVPNHPNIASMRRFLGDRFEQLDTARYSIDEINSSEAMQLLEQSWADGTFEPCLRFCAKPFDDGSRTTTDDMFMIDLKRKERQ